MQQRLRFALIGNEFQTAKAAAVQQVLEALAARGASLLIEEDFYRSLQDKGMLPAVKESRVSIFENMNFDADFVVSLGGDGTFLKAASLVGEKQIPIIGVNTGRLGFLADVLAENIQQAFDDIYGGNYHVEKHAALQMDMSPTDSTTQNTSPYALNDIAVLKRDNASMITIHAYVNHEPLVTYRADGLVLSTPTGSTAYNLSNGGPIIAPLTNVLCLTPVAPHSLNIRPIVIKDDVEVKLTVESRSGNYLIAVDGRSQTLSEKTAVTIRRAPFTVNIVKLPSRTYFTTLREKMMWGIDAR